jgi:hypothetical protein
MYARDAFEYSRHKYVLIVDIVGVYFDTHPNQFLHKSLLSSYISIMTSAHSYTTRFRFAQTS